MKDMVKLLTPDGLVGWDRFGQLWLWRPEGDSYRGQMIGDPRGHTCRICAHGWVLTSESMGDQKYWYDFKEWVHQSCSIRYISLTERDFWLDELLDAGFRFYGFEEIPNEYWTRDEWHKERPWYRVKLSESGRSLKLGTRKRVFHMEIEAREAPVDLQLATDLFSKEDVTKILQADKILVHAWTKAKVKVYLRLFAQILKSTSVPA